MPDPLQERFQLSPLIRATLISVYLALVVPLPLMAPPSLKLILWMAAPTGLVLVVALLSEQVEIDSNGIKVGHPVWCSWLLRRGWQLQWDEVRRLVPVGTSQGGTVYYLTTADLEQRLLPQRLGRFDRFLAVVQQRTGISTTSVKRLTPPWTYQLLFSLAIIMLVTESVVAFAVNSGWISIPEGYPG